MENSKIILFFLTFVSFISLSTLAHEGGSNEHQIPGKGSGVLAAIELRPSWESGSGDLFAENIIELGYKLNEKFKLGYQQEFHHNIALKTKNPEHEGLGLHLETGFLNAHLHDLLESADEKSSLSLEPRIHLPTSNEDRKKGFRAAALSYLKFRRELAEGVSFTVMDAPMFFLYSVPGATVGEEFEANPIFQNRFQAALDFSLFENKLSLSIPILFFLTKHADYAIGAPHNNAWTKFIGIAPEINYAISQNFSAGLAIVTPNLLDSQDTDHVVNHGRTSTVSQVVLRSQL